MSQLVPDTSATAACNNTEVLLSVLAARVGVLSLEELASVDFSCTLPPFLHQCLRRPFDFFIGTCRQVVSFPAGVAAYIR